MEKEIKNLVTTCRNFVDFLTNEGRQTPPLEDGDAAAFEEMRKALVKLEYAREQAEKQRSEKVVMTNDDARRVYAIVTLSIRLRLQQPWSDDVSMRDIREVALRETHEILATDIKRAPFSIVGHPKIETIIAGES